MKFDIRAARPTDGQTVADYNSRMAEETEGKALDPGRIGPGVATVYSAPSIAM
jgi:hypothetical protein